MVSHTLLFNYRNEMYNSNLELKKKSFKSSSAFSTIKRIYKYTLHHLLQKVKYLSGVLSKSLHLPLHPLSDFVSYLFLC
jgi:hypothetical protein